MTVAVDVEAGVITVGTPKSSPEPPVPPGAVVDPSPMLAEVDQSSLLDDYVVGGEWAWDYGHDMHWPA